MTNYADKKPNPTNESATKSNLESYEIAQSPVQLFDNRPAAIQQRMNQQQANTSLAVSQLKMYQHHADNSPQEQQAQQFQYIVAHANSSNKFDPIQ